MLYLIFNYFRDLLRPQRNLLLENLALRQQILVLERQVKRPKFRDRERAFWVVFSRYWSGWKSPLRLVKPETVISWHRKSWRLFWRWKSKPTDYGRPNLPLEVINLIRKMSLENPLWGAPRIHGELVMLGIDVSESTVAKYMVKRKGRPTQNWKTFLEN
ncbi:MAG: integrase, partial [bacterium]|nr:integrase [bacterium]